MLPSKSKLDGGRDRARRRRKKVLKRREDDEQGGTTLLVATLDDIVREVVKTVKMVGYAEITARK